jgi:transcriptional regulator with AAA-type ATPase domain
METAANAGNNLLVIGEPGCGKGRVARGYGLVRNRPEVEFNPMIQAVPLDSKVGPQIETLILEQVGKLGAANQATLAKLLETRPKLRIATTAVMPLEQLGIPAAIAARLSTTVLHMPPLRDRPDEMAQLAYEAVRAAEPGLQIHSTLIESCLLRPWPGNSRELVAEVSRAAHTVAAQGKNNIRGEDLDNDAGHLMIGAPPLNAAVTPTEVSKPKNKRSSARTTAKGD